MNNTKQETNLDWMDAPIKSDKWRNLCFVKDGSSYYGLCVHPTEEAAKKAIIDWEKECEQCVRNDPRPLHIELGDGSCYPFSEYSHSIQIPWK